jgi:hypothetical protein
LDLLFSVLPKERARGNYRSQALVIYLVVSDTGLGAKDPSEGIKIGDTPILVEEMEINGPVVSNQVSFTHEMPSFRGLGRGVIAGLTATWGKGNASCLFGRKLLKRKTL